MSGTGRSTSGAKSSAWGSCSTRGRAALARARRVTLAPRGAGGLGAGQRGGQGIRLDYSRPIRRDAAAASFPDLKIIAAHFGYPWHLELLAMALHKTNVYIDISGWAPRYIPPEVMRDMKTRLQDQFLFGSDYPFIQPQRCLEEMAALEIPEPVLAKVLAGNGARLLGLEYPADSLARAVAVRTTPGPPPRPTSGRPT